LTDPSSVKIDFILAMPAEIAPGKPPKLEMTEARGKADDPEKDALTKIKRNERDIIVTPTS